MSNIFHVGDTGINIELDLSDEAGLPFDISGFTEKKIIFIKPNKTEVIVNANFATNGSDGKMVYTITNNLFDIAGKWIVYAKIISNTNNRISTKTWFEVKNTY